MIIYCQMGFSRSLKEGQLIQIYHNNNLINRIDGEYLSPVAKRKTESWYMKELNCENGDIIIIESKVGLRELGEDEFRSFTAMFQVDDMEKETEFNYPKVGYGHGFPLLKGKVKQLSVLTAQEKRLAIIKSKMETENGKETSEL